MNKIIEALVKIISAIFNKNKKTNVGERKQEKKESSKIGLTQEDYLRAANTLNCDVEAIRAFAKVESRGSGFLPDGRPVILFERHIFNRLLKAKEMSCNDSSICSSKSGGYIGGAREHDRLDKAIAVDKESALQSASWGMFQCMGFNWKVCGYPSLRDFINAANRSEKDHLDMFVGFIKSNNKLLTAVRNKDWSTAARIYNGPAYKKNNYDVKLAQAYSKELEKRNTA